MKKKKTKSLINKIAEAEQSSFTPTDITQQDIVDMMKNLAAKNTHKDQCAVLGVGAIMNQDDEAFMMLLHSPGISVAGNKKSLQTVIDRYNKLLKK